MKNIFITNDWIDRFNEGELGEEELQYFSAQMVKDPLLRAEVRLDAQLNKLLADRDMMELLEKIQVVAGKHGGTRHLFRPWLVAASVIFLAGAAVICYLVLHKPAILLAGGTREDIVHVAPPAQNEEKVDRTPVYKSPVTSRNIPLSGKQGRLLAEHYRPMTELELLVGSATRSSQLTLTSPRPRVSVKAGQPLRFAWNLSGTLPVIKIVLMDNHGISHFESKQLSGREYLLQTRGFPPGLYYWKIVEEDEWLTMGTLTIY